MAPRGVGLPRRRGSQQPRESLVSGGRVVGIRNSSGDMETLRPDRGGQNQNARSSVRGAARSRSRDRVEPRMSSADDRDVRFSSQTGSAMLMSGGESDIMHGTSSNISGRSGTGPDDSDGEEDDDGDDDDDDDDSDDPGGDGLETEEVQRAVMSGETTMSSIISPSGYRRYLTSLRKIHRVVLQLLPDSWDEYFVSRSHIKLIGNSKDDAVANTLPVVVWSHVVKASLPWTTRLICAILADCQLKTGGGLVRRGTLGCVSAVLGWLHLLAKTPMTPETLQMRSVFMKGYGKKIGTMLRSGELESKKRHLLRFGAYTRLAELIMRSPKYCTGIGPRMHLFLVHLWNSTARGDNIGDLLWSYIWWDQDSFMVNSPTVNVFPLYFNFISANNAFLSSYLSQPLNFYPLSEQGEFEWRALHTEACLFERH
jgi:hypothetical protein